MREAKYRSFVKNKGMFYFTIDELLKSTVHSDGVYYSGGDMQYVWREGIKMQFTGLKDSAGKEIYEGDIVEAILNYYGKPSGIKFKAKIIYNENIGSFQISYLNINNIFVNDTIWLKYFLTVIGNIYETPELLTQNKEEK